MSIDVTVGTKPLSAKVIGATPYVSLREIAAVYNFKLSQTVNSSGLYTAANSLWQLSFNPSSSTVSISRGTVSTSGSMNTKNINGTNYVDVQYFVKMMCEVGYSSKKLIVPEIPVVEDGGLYKLSEQDFDNYLDLYLRNGKDGVTEYQKSLMSYYLSYENSNIKDGTSINDRVAQSWSSADTERQKKFIYAYMRYEFGWNAALASAFLGNIQSESRFSPTNLQDNKVIGSYGSDNSWYIATYMSGDFKDSGWGLIQWTGLNRKTELLDFAQKRHTNVADMITQLKFLNWELHNPSKAGDGTYTDYTFVNMYNQLKDGANTEDFLKTAVWIILDIYASPGEEREKLEKDPRTEQAIQIFQELGMY